MEKPPGRLTGLCKWATLTFAAGCDTSISLKMALPSFVMTMPAETGEGPVKTPN